MAETPKPMQGTWTLTAPDGRTWQADSPLRVVAAESRERIPATVALERIYAAASEDHDWLPIHEAPKDGTRVILSWGGKSINGFYLDNSKTATPWAGWRVESMVPQPAGQPTHYQPFPAPKSYAVERKASEVEAARASPADTRSEREKFWAWVEDCGCDTDGAWSAWQARASLPAPTDERDQEIAEEYSPSLYGGVADSMIAMSKEMRRLRDEVAALRARPAEPTPSVDVLRQDAERYRFLRAQNWNDGALCVVANPKVAVKPGHDCPSLARLDAAIDAARQALEKP